MSAEPELLQAIAHHQAGQLQEAERLYRDILQLHPQHAEANHNLGVLTVQRKQPEQGLPHLLAALEADPAEGRYWLDYIDALIQAGQAQAAREVLQIARQQGLQGEAADALAARLGGAERQSAGQATKQKAPTAQEVDALAALFNQGRLSEAELQAQALTQRFPQHGFGWKVLGLALKQQGRNADALTPMQKAAVLSPKEADAHSNLGVTLHDLGRLAEAEASYRRALKLKPDYADAHCNLGTLLQEMGRLDEAETELRRALKINPGMAEAHYNLGNALRSSGRLAEAADSYRKALQLEPAYVQACCNLGAVLSDLAQLDEAEMTLRRALELKPDHVEAHSNLGNTLKELGRLGEAEVSYRRALELKPDITELHNNLGILLQDTGRLTEAAAEYRRALAIKPDYFKAHSNLLFLLNYDPEVDAEVAFAEAKSYGERVAKQVTKRYAKWPCTKQTKRLRIGFVSGDLRNHPVGYFLENLLRHFDRESFELYAYPTDSWTDEMTLRLKSHFAQWKPLYGLGDEAAAKLVHGDGVHILIDLSGHSRFNRLPMFAWKPAPVQVAWLGYFATTGVAEMDYLIADAVTLPESEERYFTEKILRLPETRLCFTPPEVAVEVSPLPALKNGYVTFGCFNNLAKINDGVVALWSRVLVSVPDSRLFLKSKQLGDELVRRYTLERFAKHGIDAQRLMLEGAESRERYFAAYQRVDIALDPFPYPGGTTTVESLWMGVPVLNLSGESFLFRQGAGFLTNAGLAEWVAASQEEYVAKAMSFASDLDRLAALRAGLRQQAGSSPLMDGKRFAGYFAEALQGMWRQVQ
ncbi:MAG: tetratricopeptide repeat protein [Gammaproteobacteria bacterium]|nr:tetratricopeptide repeat protein [Gammaproteobacteria bacterium]MBU1775286.1 tetratricopeptide repeat protein [Gammaproteobacteria bacterium]MBU1968438.1 tetratricopeptide repeat protein [Gammaproteobacteria bacterium]